MDALGHVNHAVFLTYLEEGRDAFYTQTLGGDPSYVVARLEVDLRAGRSRYPERRVTVQNRGRAGGNDEPHDPRNDPYPSEGQVAAEARVVTVRWDPGHRPPIPFSKAERARLAEAMTA